MKIFSFKMISAVSILCLMAAAFVVAQPRQRPNIIFILADDLGRGDWRVYGHERLKTPNLNRLATQGTLWANFYFTGRNLKRRFPVIDGGWWMDGRATLTPSTNGKLFFNAPFISSTHHLRKKRHRSL